jgi:hypothetical protein
MTQARSVAKILRCCYRDRYEQFCDYPGSTLLDLLRAAAEQQTGYRLPRHTPPHRRAVDGYC